MLCFLSFSFVLLRQARLAPNSQSSCLCLPRVCFAGLDSSESRSACSPLMKPHGAMLAETVTNDIAGNLKHAKSDCLWRNMQKGAGDRSCEGTFFFLVGVCLLHTLMASTCYVCHVLPQRSLPAPLSCFSFPCPSLCSSSFP